MTPDDKDWMNVPEYYKRDLILWMMLDEGYGLTAQELYDNNLQIVFDRLRTTPGVTVCTGAITMFDPLGQRTCRYSVNLKKACLIVTRGW